MELKISYDDENNEYIDRLEFTKLVMSSINEYLEDEKLIVKKVHNNSVVIMDDDEEIELNVSDEMELELKLLVFILVSSIHYSAPKILFHLSVDDLDNFIISGLSLMDFSGILLSTGDTEFDYSISLGSRYLVNLFKQSGLISLKMNKDSKPSKILLVPSSKNESDENYQEFIEQFESNFAKPTVSSIRRDKQQKARYSKRIKMSRAKDPSAHRKRQQSARLRWRKHRSKYLKGMKRFHMSSRGKRINKNRGLKTSISSNMK